MNYINFEKMYCVLLDKEDVSTANESLTLWNYLLPKSTKNVMFLHATQPIELVYNHDDADDNDADNCGKRVKFLFPLFLIKLGFIHNIYSM